MTLGLLAAVRSKVKKVLQPILGPNLFNKTNKIAELKIKLNL